MYPTPPSPSRTGHHHLYSEVVPVTDLGWWEHPLFTWHVLNTDYTSSCVALQELLFLSEAQDQCLKMGPCLQSRSSWNHDSHNYVTEYQLDTGQCVYCLAAWEVWFCHSLVFPVPQLQRQPPPSTPGKLMVEDPPVPSLETTISPSR